MTIQRKLTAWTIVASLAVATSAGCSARNGISFDALIGKKNRDNVPVAKIIGVWEAAGGRDMNGSPSRGMAGQISFYKPGNPSPVPVEGTVKVYVFDDQGSKSERSKPIHIFKFDSKSWSRHLKETQLGPTYHVFIPYTRKVVHQVEAAIAVRFFPDKPNAQQASSDLAPLTLPGPRRAGKEETKLQIVSDQIPRKKAKVSTYNTGVPVGEAINNAEKARIAPQDQRNPSNFRNFDLNRQTLVKTLRPGNTPAASAVRNGNYDQALKTLLRKSGSRTKTPRQIVDDPNSTDSAHTGHRDSLDHSSGFRLRTSNSTSVRKDRRVRQAAFERDADASRRISRRHHPLEGAEVPGRDHGRRPGAIGNTHRHPLAGGHVNQPPSTLRALESNAAVNFNSPTSYRSRRSQQDRTPRPANVNHPFVDERRAFGSN